MCSDRVFHDHNIKAIKPVYSLSNEYAKALVTVNCTPPLILMAATLASCSRLALVLLKFLLLCCKYQTDYVGT